MVTSGRIGVLALSDGFVLRGVGFGAHATVVGEVVFNTAMSGYQEILTDPSYTGQLVCLTVAEVGNVGVNPEDRESTQHGAEGLICRSLSPVVSNWRSRGTLADDLAARGRPGLCEVDTRALTRHLRTSGAVVGVLSTERTDADALVQLARDAPTMQGQGLGESVSCEAPYRWHDPTWACASRGAALPDARGRVVVVDFGVKLGILRHLRDAGVEVEVVPATTEPDAIAARNPDGVLLSNGPGDPAALPEAVERIRGLLQRCPELPVFGICLGHQLLSLALGGRTFKLKFGHHGGNHPVRHEPTGAVEITSQNHGFAVDPQSLSQVAVTHINLFDNTCAGLRARDRPVWSVQYHPEAGPGPGDASHLLAEFAAAVAERAAAAAAG